MTIDMKETWDGQPISQEPPHGAAVVVYRWEREGLRYLVLHRGHKGPEYDGDWAWGPPSGCRLPGESIDECARRELREEAGLTLAVTRTDAGTEDWWVYRAEAPPGAEVTLSAEHDRYVWLPAREAAAISLPPLVGEQVLAVARALGDPGVYNLKGAGL